MRRIQGPVDNYKLTNYKYADIFVSKCEKLLQNFLHFLKKHLSVYTVYIVGIYLTSIPG